MPAEPKDKDGFTAKQRAFISEFVSIGEKNGTKAAERAGYAKDSAYQRAHELLQDPKILDGIGKERRKQYQTDASVAKRILNEIMVDDSNPASVRKDAALALMDRAGDKHAEKQELIDSRTPAQQAERVKELQQKLKGVG